MHSVDSPTDQTVIQPSSVAYSDTHNNGWLDEIAWNERGLVPAIAQSVVNERVLTLAWMNRESLAATVASGYATYWSRSRGKLWCKGETSGHYQRLIELCLDCDGDTLLLRVEQIGDIACHTGRESCFFQVYEKGRWLARDPVLIDPERIYGQHGQT